MKLAGISGKKTKYLTIDTTEKTNFPDRLSLTVVMPEQINVAEKRLRWESGENSSKSIQVKSAIKDAVPFVADITPKGAFVATMSNTKESSGGYQLSITPEASAAAAKRAIVKIGVRSPDGVTYYESVAVSRP